MSRDDPAPWDGPAPVTFPLTDEKRRLGAEAEAKRRAWEAEQAQKRAAKREDAHQVRTDAAECLHDLGYVVVPLHHVEPNAVCTCSKGRDCRNAGKHPVHEDWGERARQARFPLGPWCREPWNVGIALGPQRDGTFVVVVDCDPHNGGNETWIELVAEHGDLPPGPMSITGQKGWHRFLRSTEPLPGSKKLGRGIDFKSGGGMVVVPPSRSGKGPYRWHRQLGPPRLLQLMPSWVVEAVRRPEPTTYTYAPRERGAALDDGWREADRLDAEDWLVNAAVRLRAEQLGAQSDHLLSLCVKARETVCAAGLLDPEVVARVLYAATEEWEQRDDRKIVAIIGRYLMNGTAS